MAEAVGFEPTKPFRTHAFQACAIDHYATLPESVYRVAMSYLPKTDIHKIFTRALYQATTRDTMSAQNNIYARLSIKMNYSSHDYSGFGDLDHTAYQTIAKSGEVKASWNCPA